MSICYFYSTHIIRAGKRKRAGTGKHCDYLDKREYGPVKRRRTDPVISLSIFLENGEQKKLYESELNSEIFDENGSL